MTQTWNLPTRNNQNKKVAYINARLIDPLTGLDIKGELLTIGDKIADFGTNIFGSSIPADATIIDCKNHILAPGLIDLQVHFREPGQTHKEDIYTGSKSAASGGITTVVCQPNTKPTIDNVDILDLVHYRAQEKSHVNLKVYACISKEMKGEELTDMGKLIEAGAVGFTDDGLPVMSANLMRRAFEYSSMFNTVIAQHAEDLNLTHGGCMNEGKISFELGLTGMPAIAESVIIARDILLLKEYGGRYHVLHVSSKDSVEVIRWGKSLGLNITCEAAPHHFALTDEAVRTHGTYAKMNPPLKTEVDRLAIIEGLKDGTVDAIATDHAPHEEAVKNCPMQSAAFGIVGLETMLPISLELYHQKILTLQQVLAKMTCNAAKIINSPAGVIAKGAPADLTLIDLEQDWTIDISKFSSKSKNSPFDGRKVKGRAIITIVGGEIVYSY